MVSRGDWGHRDLSGTHSDRQEDSSRNDIGVSANTSKEDQIVNGGGQREAPTHRSIPIIGRTSVLARHVQLGIAVRTERPQVGIGFHIKASIGRGEGGDDALRNRRGRNV